MRALECGRILELVRPSEATERDALSSRTRCDVAVFLAEIFGADADVEGGSWVCADVGILRLVLAEALSNARVHREPGTRIRVVAVAAGGTLHVQVSNVLRAGVPPLSDEECVRAFDGSVLATGSGMAGLGLEGVAMVLAAINGRAWLSSGVAAGPLGEARCTVLNLTMPCHEAPLLAPLMMDTCNQ